MNPLISIIVPVYNVSDYIDRCVDSIVTQTYANLEIILVNDGSKDDSLEKCNKWAEADKRVKVLNKQNGGVSSARNVGLKASTGDYIGFIDPDDWIEKDMYEKLLNLIITDGSRAAFCNYSFIYGDKPVIEITRNEKMCTTSSDALMLCLKSSKRGGGYFTSIWNKLFDRETVFKGSDCIMFNEDLCVGEDELWLFQVLNDDFNVSFTSESFYNYFQREGGALSARDSKQITRHSLDSVKSKKIIYDFYKNNIRNSDVFELIKARLYIYTYVIEKSIYKQYDKSLKKSFGDNYRIGIRSFLRSDNYSMFCKFKVGINRVFIKLKFPETIVDAVDTLSASKKK